MLLLAVPAGPPVVEPAVEVAVVVDVVVEEEEEDDGVLTLLPTGVGLSVGEELLLAPEPEFPAIRAERRPWPGAMPGGRLLGRDPGPLLLATEKAGKVELYCSWWEGMGLLSDADEVGARGPEARAAFRLAAKAGVIHATTVLCWLDKALDEGGGGEVEEEGIVLPTTEGDSWLDGLGGGRRISPSLDPWEAWELSTASSTELGELGGW